MVQNGATFPFAVESKYRPLLAPIGVSSDRAWARIGSNQLTVKFGFLGCSTPLSNITCVEITGPYKAYRAIGARGSFSDTGATYGSTTVGGVCMEFDEPIPALDPTGLIRNEALTVTVADLEGFATALRRATGLD